MQHYIILSAGLLALAACTPTPRPALDAVSAAPPRNMTGSSAYQGSGSVATGLVAAPPDNPTGSSSYQSPDLDDTHTLLQAKPPRRDTGSSAYQR